MLNVEQFVAAQKTQLDTLFGLTGKAFEGVEKLAALNLRSAKTALDEVGSHARAVLAAKDAQELVALHAKLVEPAAEKASTYSRLVYEIAAETNADLSKALEAQWSQAQTKLMDLVDATVKNAPPGTENATALVRSTVTSASNAFESVHRAAKQAADIAEANFQAMTSAATVKATQGAAKTRRAA